MHAATIGDELARHHSAQADLDARRREAEEALAEARSGTRSGSTPMTSGSGSARTATFVWAACGSSSATVGNEITRLAEVQALIADRRAPPEPAPPPPAPPP